jgi:threonyl-tRNA synthetase
MNDEISEVLRFSLHMWRVFGFHKYKVYLATRPANSIGSEQMWQDAQDTLRKVIAENNLEYEVDEGGGAFYGPKIDLKIEDALGREWQMTTIQFDFTLPERFDLVYVGADGQEHRPYMIHRALLGAWERFFGLLIEHYGGAFPTWLSPVQVKIIPVADRHLDYARRLEKELKGHAVRVEVDDRPERINAKIRQAQMEKVPYMLVVGDKEVAENTVSIRRRSGEQATQPFADFIQAITAEIASRA